MKNRKRISILLVLAMVMTMLSGLAAPAGAATPSVNIRGVSVNVAPTPPATLGLVDLTSAAERVVAGGSSLAVTVRLPDGFTFAVDPAVAAVHLDGAAAGAGSYSVVPARADSNRNVVFTIAPPSANVNSLRFLVGSVAFPATHRGAINAEVTLRNFVVSGTQEITMWEQTGTVQVGNVIAAGTTSAAVTKPTIQRGVSNQLAGNITITENVVGGFVTSDTITLRAPEGVLFTETPTVEETGGLVAAPATLTAPARDVVITVGTGSSTARSVITVSNIRFNVSPLVADGDIGVAITGTTGKVTPATVANAAVGAVAVGQVTVDADPATPAADRVVTAGRAEVAIANIRLRETSPGAIQAGRVVSFTLPTGFTWNDPSVTFGTNPEFTAPSATAEGGRTLFYWTSGSSSTAQTRIFTGLTINASATAPAGDITVTVGGTAGVSGTVVVGRARTPYAVTAAAAPNVRSDLRNQALGNLVITENFAGAFRATSPASSITVNLPAGVTVAVGVTPTVAVTGGPGTMTPAGDVTVATDRRSFTVDTAASPSTAASTWTVSGIRVDLDRVPLGDLSFTVGGTALIPSIDVAGSGLVVDARVLGTSVASVVLGKVISPTATRSVFTIGALTFVRDGVTTAIDAAPAIVDGRTLLPLRFAALAVGVSAEDIIWDATRRTVTLLRGDRVVQLRIGDRFMTINGASIPLDVPAAIQNGRTVLPIRAIAQALRADIAWDATARTVTVTAQ